MFSLPCFLMWGVPLLPEMHLHGLNTDFVVRCAVVAWLCVLSCAVVAYLVIQRRMPFRVPLLLVFSGVLIWRLGALNTYAHTGLSDASFFIPPPWMLVAAMGMNVLMLGFSFVQTPDEMVDSARLDGAGDWRLFSRIYLPCAIQVFLLTTVWNLFLFMSGAPENQAFFSIQGVSCITPLF